MTKRLKNTTADIKKYRGQNIAPGEYFDVPEIRGTEWQVDPAIKADITAGTLIMNDGTTDFSATEGLKRYASSGSLVQTVFKQLAINASSNSQTYASFLSQSITTSSNTLLIVQFTACVSSQNDNIGVGFQIRIDNVIQLDGGLALSKKNLPGCCTLNYRASNLSAGSHTILIEWKVTANTVYCDPTSGVGESATLLLSEVLV